MDSPLLAEVLLPVAIATIMCSLGLALTPADYSSFMLFTGGAFAWMMSRRNVAIPAAEPDPLPS